MWKDPNNYKQLIEKYIHVALRLERCRRQLQAAEQYCEKWNDTAAHSTSTEYIDLKSWPIEPKLCEEDSPDASKEQSSVAQELRTEVENSSQMLEEVENSNTSEEVENLPKASEEVENLPKTSEEVENLPKVSQEVENLPKVSQEVENSSKTSEYWHNYYLPMTLGAVIGLAYLIHKSF